MQALNFVTTKKILFRNHLIWGLMALLLLCGQAMAGSLDHPFVPGEKLTYALKWGLLTVGESTLEVGAIERINGEPVYHFKLEAKSYPAIDLIYKVRDQIDAYADLEMSKSLLYRKKQHEGSTKRNVTVQFDWEAGQAQYANHDDTRDPIELMPGSFDPLSAFFFSRTIKLKENEAYERPVTDGKKCVMGRAHVVKRETLTINGESFDTFLIEPELNHVGGVFEESRDATMKIWVTADERRIPVKLSSKVIVGSFVGELISVEYNEVAQNPLKSARLAVR